jgi:selenide,water dikinase
MIEGTELDVLLDSESIPLLPGVGDCASMGLLSEGLHRNRSFAGERLRAAGRVERARLDAICDPQTSGGLLAALPADEADSCVAELHEAGIDEAAVIGELSGEGEGVIHVR